MRQQIVQILKKIIPFSVKAEVFSPAQNFGHYSTNAAFKIAASLKKKPLEIAKDLAEKIKKLDKGKLFKRVEVSQPGFINFWILENVWQTKVKEILKEGAHYGKSKLGKNKKVQVEFISANPTGPLTLANGRGGFLGDVLANILAFSGFKVEREYYVNDTGNQIIKLGNSLIVALGLNLGQQQQEEKRGDKLYQGLYIKDWARKHRGVVKKYKSEPLILGRFAAKEFLKNTKRVIIQKARIKFNRFTSEFNHIYKKKYPEKALAIFKKAGLVYEKEGAIWLKTAKFGDDKDRVLLTSDCQSTYFLNDSGHYLETVRRGFNKKINILGPDHYGYVKRIQAAAKILGLKDSTVIITQAIRLLEKGQGVKMSKRMGKFVTFEDLLKEINLDVARFFFLMVSSDSHLDFDLSLAKEKTLKNPVYYVQYAYVRSWSILKKAKIKTISVKVKLDPLKTFEDIKLIQELVKFPEIIEDAAGDYQIHRLTRYATELAKAFHNFYEKERVIEKGGDINQARLILVKASSLVLKNLLILLGIKAPKKM